MKYDELYDKAKSLEDKLIKCDHEKMELLEAYKELLIDSIGLYSHYPNNFRYTEKEYFKTDFELLKKHGIEI